LARKNTMIEEKINELKKKLVDYTSIVMSMVERSIKGLVERQEEVLNDIIEHDEPKANEFEIELDEMCTTLIIQLQPKAVDLRTILMILKMDNDLERIADHAVNIAQSAQYLIEVPIVKPLIDIPRMAKDVIKMLNDSINSFISEDAILAKSVCERDSVIDALRDQILRELITYMISDITTIQRSLHLLNVTKNLERIADLSTNICEEVIYLVEGRVIKHHKEERE
jgi:phosphate transport system protein